MDQQSSATWNEGLGSLSNDAVVAAITEHLQDQQQHGDGGNSFSNGNSLQFSDGEIDHYPQQSDNTRHSLPPSSISYNDGHHIEPGSLPNSDFSVASAWFNSSDAPGHVSPSLQRAVGSPVDERASDLSLRSPQYSEIGGMTARPSSSTSQDYFSTGLPFDQIPTDFPPSSNSQRARIPSKLHRGYSADPPQASNSARSSSNNPVPTFHSPRHHILTGSDSGYSASSYDPGTSHYDSQPFPDSSLLTTHARAQIPRPETSSSSGVPRMSSVREPERKNKRYYIIATCSVPECTFEKTITKLRPPGNSYNDSWDSLRFACSLDHLSELLNGYSVELGETFEGTDGPMRLLNDRIYLAEVSERAGVAPICSIHGDPSRIIDMRSGIFMLSDGTFSCVTCANVHPEDRDQLRLWQTQEMRIRREYSHLSSHQSQQPQDQYTTGAIPPGLQPIWRASTAAVTLLSPPLDPMYNPDLIDRNLNPPSATSYSQPYSPTNFLETIYQQPTQSTFPSDPHPSSTHQNISPLDGSGQYRWVDSDLTLTEATPGSPSRWQLDSPSGPLHGMTPFNHPSQPSLQLLDYSSNPRAPISTDGDPSTSAVILNFLKRNKGIVSCSASGCRVTESLNATGSHISSQKWETVRFACSAKHLLLLLPTLELTTTPFQAKAGPIDIVEDRYRVESTLFSNRIALFCSLHEHSDRKVINLSQGAVRLGNGKFSCVTCVLTKKERSTLGLIRGR